MRPGVPDATLTCHVASNYPLHPNVRGTVVGDADWSNVSSLLNSLVYSVGHITSSCSLSVVLSSMM